MEKPLLMTVYFFSKFLPLLVLPLGLAIFFLAIYLYYNRKWMLAVALFILLPFSSGAVAQGLWRILEYPWTRLAPEDVKQADAIVVLSSARHLSPGVKRIIEWHDPDRFFAGINLFKAKKAPRLFFTGGSIPYMPELPPEGSIYLEEAIALGLSKNDLATTPPVINTVQEALEVRKLVNELTLKEFPKVILVTSAFHMKRAKKLFERQGLLVEPFPVDFKSRAKFGKMALISPSSWFPNAGSLSSSSKALREVLGRIIYRSW